MQHRGGRDRLLVVPPHTGVTNTKIYNLMWANSYYIFGFNIVFEKIAFL